MKKQSTYFLIIISAVLFFSSSHFDLAQGLKTHQAEDFILARAYAPAFGTGVYRVRDNREVYVLRVRPMFTHRFKFEKVFKDRELVLEFKLPISSRWNLRFLGNLGYGSDTESGGEKPGSIGWVSRAELSSS